MINAPRYYTMVQSNVMPAAGNGKMLRVCQPSNKPLVPLVPLYVLDPANRWQNYSVQTPTKPTLVMHYLRVFPRNCPISLSSYSKL